MKDRSPESIDKALTSVEKAIEHYHAAIATMEELKTTLRIARVWPGVWGAQRRVKVIDHFDHKVIHPIGNRRPQTKELSDRLYRRIRRSKVIVGKLTDGERDRELTKLELAYIRGYLDTLETEL